MSTAASGQHDTQRLRDARIRAYIAAADERHRLRHPLVHSQINPREESAMGVGGQTASSQGTSPISGLLRLLGRR